MRFIILWGVSCDGFENELLDLFTNMNMSARIALKINTMLNFKNHNNIKNTAVSLTQNSIHCT